MAKPKPCEKCGKWYNPRFAGNDEICGNCLLKEKFAETSEDVDLQKVKTPASSGPAPAKPQTTHRAKTTASSVKETEYKGTCEKCGLLIEGSEVYDRERGWIYVWVHLDNAGSKRKYCLAS